MTSPQGFPSPDLLVRVKIQSHLYAVLAEYLQLSDPEETFATSDTLGEYAVMCRVFRIEDGELGTLGAPVCDRFSPRELLIMGELQKGQPLNAKALASRLKQNADQGFRAIVRNLADRGCIGFDEDENTYHALS